MKEINHALESTTSIIQQSASGAQGIAQASEAATQAAEAINEACKKLVEGTRKLDSLVAEFKIWHKGTFSVCHNIITQQSSYGKP